MAGDIFTYAGLVDIDRAELEGRIAAAERAIADLLKHSDPTLRLPRSEWTVRDVAGHLLTLAHRYTSIRTTGGPELAADPRGVDRLNAEQLAELEGVGLDELTEQLFAEQKVIREIFHEIPLDRTFPFHGGVLIDTVTAGTNWLGELLLHGYDVAYATGAEWSLVERDMLMVLRGVFQITPAYLNHEAAAGRDLMVAFRMPGAREWVLHVHDDTLDSRPRTAGDRPHAVLRVPAPTLALTLYQRIRTIAAVRRGMLIVGGTRPWTAFQLQALIHKP